MRAIFGEGHRLPLDGLAFFLFHKVDGKFNFFHLRIDCISTMP